MLFGVRVTCCDESGFVADDDELQTITRSELAQKPSDIGTSGSGAAEEASADLVI